MISWQNLLTRYIERMGDGEPHTDLAGDFAAEIHDACHAEEPWASAIVDTALRSYCREHLNRAHKDLHSLRARTSSGRVRRITASTSRKNHDAKTGDVVSRERTLVWGYKLAEMEAYCDELIRIGSEHRERQQAWFKVRAALRAHPDLTAAQAWVAEGHSLEEIDLSA